MSRPVHLVTGATGFVGGALVLELLARTDAHILCLTRPRPGREPADRLRASLIGAAKAYGVPELGTEIRDRCQALAGDLTEPQCGLASLPGAVDQVWHAAGSLSFSDDRADRIYLHNVTATAHTLELARKLSARCFSHVSTAYVSGRRTGFIEAAPVTDDSLSNNYYERSKIAAENIVLTSATDIDCVRIFRPSIVIGHSQTYAATRFNGLYGFIRGLVQVRSAVKPVLGDYLAFRPLRLRGDVDALINFVPVDRVAEAAVSVGLADDNPGIYHLANSQQAILGPSFTVLAERLNMMAPRFVRDEGEFSLIDERVDQRLVFYHPYMTGARYFDLASTCKATGTSVLEYSLSADVLGNFIDWYLRRQRRKKDKDAHVND
jgi:nucleoside-diphosphate-sugar epimerase